MVLRASSIAIYRRKNHEIQYLLVRSPAKENWIPVTCSIKTGEQPLDAVLQEAKQLVSLSDDDLRILKVKPIKSTLYETSTEEEGKLCDYLIAELRNPFKEPKASELLDGMEWSNIYETKSKVFTRENQHVYDLLHREVMKVEEERKLKAFA
ncbi:NUDT2.2 family protein [Megaselia abdita]